jgi:hypothetical protein
MSTNTNTMGTTRDSRLRQRRSASSGVDPNGSSSSNGNDKGNSIISGSGSKGSTGQISNPQQRMLRQIAKDEVLERQQMRELESYSSQRLSGLMKSYTSAILVIFATATAVLTYYFGPQELFIFLGLGNNKLVVVTLRSRMVMTVYPESLGPIKSALPRWVEQSNYAVATPDNRIARQAVRRVAAMRRVVTDSSGINSNINSNSSNALVSFQQSITLHGWEHEDFNRQLPPPGHPNRSMAADHLCGNGFFNAYYADATTKTMMGTTTSPPLFLLRDDLLIWCLVASGYHDSYVKYPVVPTASLTRGSKGTAAQYLGDTNRAAGRIHSAFLFLPILPLPTETPTPAVEMSNGTTMTSVPRQIRDWLLYQANSGLATNSTEEDIRTRLEELLYRIIQEERDLWVIMNAACTVDERAMLDATQYRLASTCPTDDDDNGDTIEVCCSFYDPRMKPWIPRNDDDDDSYRMPRKQGSVQGTREGSNVGQDVSGSPDAPEELR